MADTYESIVQTKSGPVSGNFSELTGKTSRGFFEFSDGSGATKIIEVSVESCKRKTLTKDELRHLEAVCIVGQKPLQSRGVQQENPSGAKVEVDAKRRRSVSDESLNPGSAKKVREESISMGVVDPRWIRFGELCINRGDVESLQEAVKEGFNGNSLVVDFRDEGKRIPALMSFVRNARVSQMSAEQRKEIFWILFNSAPDKRGIFEYRLADGGVMNLMREAALQNDNVLLQEMLLARGEAT